MRGVDPRVVEVTAALPRGTSWASGYRIGPSLILTARHVIEDDGVRAQAYAVRPLGSPTFVPATVDWWSDVLDIAVLRVEPADLPPMHPGSVPRWGRLESDRQIPCRITGFPMAHARADDRGRQVRDPEPIDGTLKTATAAKREIVHIAVTGSVPDRASVGSLWQGMSGAAVLSGPWLLGVVTSDPANFGPDRLSATLVETAVADPRLRGLLEADGISAELGVADLPRALTFPYRDPPAAMAVRTAGRSLVRLLQPEYEVVPFIGRAPEVAELTGWCADGERVSARLLAGPGGQGKSRLAAELCRMQAAEGWLAGTLTQLAGGNDLDALLALPSPLLIVVDWADTHVQQIVDIAQRTSSAAAGPVRLLLLARRAGEWWENLSYRAGDVAHEVFEAAATTWLGPVAGDVAARREHYQTAVGAFARRLGRDGVDAAEPDLSAAFFETILLIHLKALIDVDTPSRSRPTELGDTQLLEELLRREDVAYWEAAAPPSLRGEAWTTTRKRALAVATLTAAGSEDDARRALRALPDFESGDPTPALGWLRTLYPGDGFLGPLRPDLLGEALVAQVVRDRSDLPLRLLPETGAGWATRLLTVLGQAAGSHPSLLGPLAGVLDDRLSTLVEQARTTGDPSLGHALALALTRAGSIGLARAFHELLEGGHSFALAEAAVAGYQMLLSHAPDAGDLPRLYGNLAIWLDELGRDEEALAASEHAVGAQRELADDRGGVQRWALAITLNNLSSQLRKADQAERGLAAADEAVAILADGEDPDWPIARWLAAALSNRSDCLQALGRDREAFEAMERAVTIMRDLARVDEAYRPDLARSLENWSDKLARWRRRDESLAAMDECVAVYRAITQSDPDAYRTDLARALYNASQTYARWGAADEALALAMEAEPLCRELAEARPLRYRVWLAKCLDGKADALESLDRHAEALPVRAEVVSVYQELSGDDPLTHRSALAAALTAQATCLHRLDRLDEALTAVSRAVEVHATGDGSRPGDGAASALLEQSRLMSALGRPGEAVEAAASAAEIYRALVAVRPDAYHANLTTTLTERARLLIEAGRVDEALADLDEATALPRQLASEQPQAFWALVTALMEKADCLERMGDVEAAQVLSREAGHLPMPAGMEIVVPSLEMPEV